jgi:Flp pilus assembly protein TadG
VVGCAVDGAPTRRRARGDAGATIVGWFVKIALTLALVGTLAFDGISIAQAHARADDTAAQAADAAAQAYAPQKSQAQALQAATKVALAADAAVPPNGIIVNADGTVTIVIHVVAHTTLLGHLPGTAAMIQITSTATGSKVTS